MAVVAQQEAGLSGSITPEEERKREWSDCLGNLPDQGTVPPPCRQAGGLSCEQEGEFKAGEAHCEPPARSALPFLLLEVAPQEHPPSPRHGRRGGLATVPWNCLFFHAGSAVLLASSRHPALPSEAQLLAGEGPVLAHLELGLVPHGVSGVSGAARSTPQGQAVCSPSVAVPASWIIKDSFAGRGIITSVWAPDTATPSHWHGPSRGSKSIPLLLEKVSPFCKDSHCHCRQKLGHQKGKLWPRLHPVPSPGPAPVTGPKKLWRLDQPLRLVTLLFHGQSNGLRFLLASFEGKQTLLPACTVNSAAAVRAVCDSEPEMTGLCAPSQPSSPWPATEN
ncbi:uncharacterized protein LOC110567289 [Aotus nancymaae]|uniref:uncharacterized protein LOC110567289 n=1 Tax=Aotus nancymaae TaxID=37293 RepID=UPI0030FE992B